MSEGRCHITAVPLGNGFFLFGFFWDYRDWQAGDQK
jgi:hypothetical protein